MIDSFQILVPSSARVGEAFDVTVRALDSGGSVLTTDSTSVIALTSGDPNLLFDATGDGNFTANDNQKQLTNGEAVIAVLDSKSDNFNLFADNSPDGPITITGNLNVLYTFNTVFVRQDESSPADTRTLDHPKFFQARDTLVRDAVAIEEPVGGALSNTEELREELPVTLVP